MANGSSTRAMVSSPTALTAAASSSLFGVTELAPYIKLRHLGQVRTSKALSTHSPIYIDTRSKMLCVEESHQCTCRWGAAAAVCRIMNGRWCRKRAGFASSRRPWPIGRGGEIDAYEEGWVAGGREYRKLAKIKPLEVGETGLIARIASQGRKCC